MFFTSVDNSIVVLQFSLLLFMPVKQRNSKNHPSGLVPKSGVQRLASWLGITWSRSTFVPLPREMLPGEQCYRGWQKPIYYWGQLQGLEQRWCWEQNINIHMYHMLWFSCKEKEWQKVLIRRCYLWWGYPWMQYSL